MPVKQSIELARAERVGAHGVEAKVLADMLKRCGPSLEKLRQRHKDNSLPLLRLPARKDDLATTIDAAKRLGKDATDVVILGTGGSSLGGQALIQLAGYNVPGIGAFRGFPRLHFMDNLDPDTFGTLLDVLPLKSTRFIAISKSGGTGETLMQTVAALDAVRRAGVSAQQTFFGISEPAKLGGKNGLRDLLTGLGVPMHEHDTGIGGRFSVLTNVGLLPAAIAGLDIGRIRDGAAKALAPVLEGKQPEDVPAALGAALSIALSPTKPITVMMAYADRLERFTKWYVQLWAESLGKDGKGTTPVAALGPVDQHSQLQLFIGGPRDKLFTVITAERKGLGPRIPMEMANAVYEPGLGGRTIGDLVAAQGRATAETLAKNGCPVRTIEIERLNEPTLGYLLMHFMLETIIAADLVGVDAFDQPAVEEGKILAKKYVTEA
jgi:glucose-6-phosphate isomerase